MSFSPHEERPILAPLGFQSTSGAMWGAVLACPEISKSRATKQTTTPAALKRRFSSKPTNFSKKTVGPKHVKSRKSITVCRTMATMAYHVPRTACILNITRRRYPCVRVASVLPTSGRTEDPLELNTIVCRVTRGRGRRAGFSYVEE